jgi:hypothetical protein
MIPRAQLIERSLSCLTFGATGFIPVLGLFFSIMSLARFRVVVVETNDRWNPARRQLYLGLIFALLSILIHAIVAAAIAIQIIRYYEDV